MRRGSKPVRKCYPCLLNLGDRCWLYVYPRGQWREGRRCPGFENEAIYSEFEKWRKSPTVKTRKELRREFFRTPRAPKKQREELESELLRNQQALEGKE
jgi:hypothetical protein